MPHIRKLRLAIRVPIQNVTHGLSYQRYILRFPHVERMFAARRSAKGLQSIEIQIKLVQSGLSPSHDKRSPLTKDTLNRHKSSFAVRVRERDFQVIQFHVSSKTLVALACVNP